MGFHHTGWASRVGGKAGRSSSETVMSPFRRFIPRRLLEEGSLDWLDRTYGLDWITVVSIWTMAFIASYSPIYERSFDLKDPLISHPHRHDTVSSSFNFITATWLPIGIVAVTGLIRKSLMDIHHGILSLLGGCGLAHLLTVLGKHLVGRLRPDFLARCKWDHIMKTCAGKIDTVMSGRKSFPSGHSSTAFSGMTFVALYVAGKTAAWCFSAPPPRSSRKMHSSRMFNFFLTLIPLLWASFVAISRVEDYRHHKEDVVVGSLIGIVSATISYLMFWPSPFSPASFQEESAGMPRDLYTQSENRARVDFQLTQLEDGEQV